MTSSRSTVILAVRLVIAITLLAGLVACSGVPPTLASLPQEVVSSEQPPPPTITATPLPTATPPPTATVTITAVPDPTTVDASELAEKTGAIQLEGFTFNWNETEERVEYVDEKGRSIAYWTSEGRIELMLGVVELDFQVHRGLFIKEDSRVVAQRYQETGKMPLPFYADSGIVGEFGYNETILYVSKLADNSPIVAFSSGSLKRFRVDAGTKENDAVMFTTTEGDFYRFTGKISEGWVVPESVVSGDIMLLATNPEFSELPIPQYRDSMFLIGKEYFRKVDILGLRDLMTDNFGRIIMMASETDN